jgi:hypothetical protein
MASDLAFLTGVGGASRPYTPASRKADGTLATQTDTPIIEISGPVLGTLADAPTPDPGAANASKSLISLLAGAVAHLLVSRGYLKILSDAAQSTDATSVTQAAQGAMSVLITTGIGATGANAVTTMTDGVQTSQQSPTDATKGVLVSAQDLTARRCFKNTGNVALNLMPAKNSHGTGWPLAPGESFTYDASGRMSGDVYASAAGPGGSCTVMKF